MVKTKQKFRETSHKRRRKINVSNGRTRKKAEEKT